MELGVIVSLSNAEENFKKLKEYGFTTCQLNSFDVSIMTEETAKKVLAASKEYGIRISALWCGWSGPCVWDFYSGPHTLGLVPLAYREARIKELKIGSDFAKMLGVEDIVTHVGFLPEIPTSTEYYSLITALRDLAEYIKGNGQYFLFETGQETPVTLKRVIEDVGTGNLGINLDPANLILYGMGNPIDALDVFGEYVRGVHAKDGFYPTDSKKLGKQVPLGEGKVNFPLFMKKLKEVGYTGAITIEREIRGEQQTKDILAAKKLLETLM